MMDGRVSVCLRPGEDKLNVSLHHQTCHDNNMATQRFHERKIGYCATCNILDGCICPMQTSFMFKYLNLCTSCFNIQYSPPYIYQRADWDLSARCEAEHNIYASKSYKMQSSQQPRHRICLAALLEAIAPHRSGSVCHHPHILHNDGQILNTYQPPPSVSCL